MQAGRLDEHITIQGRSVTQSRTGDIIESWTVLGALRISAGVRPASGGEGFTMPQTVATEFTEFTVYWQQALAGLAPTDRLIYPALSQAEYDAGQAAAGRRVYDIVAIHPIGRREGLRIVATRRPDSAAYSEGVGMAAGAGS